MRPWLLRNKHALLIIALMLALIVVTITYPSWQRKIGDQRPQQTVRYGQSTVIGGARWQLIAIDPPDTDQLKKGESLPESAALYPADSRLVPFALQREEDGKPAANPPGFSLCYVSVVDGRRRWRAQVTPLGVQFWATRAGYASYYTGPGPLLVGLFVPTSAHITAVDVQFIPAAPDDEQQPGKSPRLLVVRFDTG